MRTFSTLVLSAVFLSGCAPDTASLTEDQRPVVEAAITYFASSSEVPIALSDTTYRSFLRWDATEGEANPDSAFSWWSIPDSALVSSFVRDTRSGTPLPLFDHANVVRYPSDEADPPVDSATRLRMRALGVTTPEISEDESTAILEYIINCNAVTKVSCSTAGFLVLEIQAGRWSVVFDEELWIS